LSGLPTNGGPDFGWGPHVVALQDVVDVVPISPRDGQHPQALLLARSGAAEPSRWDQNRIIHKCSGRWAKLHRFKGSAVLPVILISEDQTEHIVAAIEKRISDIG